MADESVLLGELAEEFTARVRRGELPEIEDYARRQPRLAERVRALFPTLMLLEGLAAGRTTTDGDVHRSPDLAAGTQFGPYRTERELGRGGMGIVYEAVHLALHRRVALKVLHMDGAQQAKHLERFFREAQTAAGLHHTNIVPVFDVGQVNGVPYYAMQFIAGRGLDRVLREGECTSLAATVDHLRASTSRKPPPSVPVAVLFPSADTVQSPSLPARRVAEIGIQAAEGLAYAHERGVIHRDIKPSNLLLDDHGVVWITDFGLARRLEDVALTHSGTLVGTPRYMSPEQAEAARRPVDHRTDIYSLGATLYELLTRRPAFDAPTPLELVFQILEREPIAPRRLDRSAPRDLETIILKAMAKRPEDRYATAAMLAEDLRRFLNDEPIRARRIGFVQRTVKWAKRRPAAAGLIAVSLSALFAVLGIVLAYSAQLRSTNEDLEHAIQDARAQHRTTRRHRYVAELNLAHRYFDMNAFPTVVSLLRDQHPGPDEEDLRGFEWHYLWRLCHREHRVIQAHPRLHFVRSSRSVLSITPDGRTAVTLGTAGGDDYSAEVKLWDLPSGKLRFQLPVQGEVESIALSPDGRILATSSGSEKTVKLWDVSGATENSTLQLEHAVTRIQFSPDGKRLVTLCNDVASTEHSQAFPIRIWDTDKGKELSLQRPEVQANQFPLVAALEFSPDNGWLAAAYADRMFDLWDLTTGQRTALKLGKHIVGCLAFSPNGRLLATGHGQAFLPRLNGMSTKGDLLTGQPAFVQLWELPSVRLLGTTEVRGMFPVRLGFSPDGDSLAVLSQEGIFANRTTELTVWRLEPMREKFTLRGNDSAAILDFQYASDGSTLAVDCGASAVRIHDPETGRLRETLPGPPGDLRQLCFTADGQTLCTLSTDGIIRIWPLTARASDTLGEGRLRPHAAAFSPDRACLALAAFDRSKQEEVVRIWNTQTGALAASPKGHRPHIGDSALSPSGTLLALIVRQSATMVSSSDPGEVQIWDVVKNQELHYLNAHSKAISKLCFNTDGTLLATFGDDRFTRVWDVPAGRKLWELRAHSRDGHHAYVEALAFSPDGRSLVTSEGSGAVRVWSMRDGSELFNFPAETAGTSAIAFHPNGELLALAGRDGTVRLWNAVQRREELRLRGHQGSVRAVCFSPDGRRIASGGEDMTVRVWDLATGRELLTLRGHTLRIETLSFAPDGSRLISICGDEVKVWDARPMAPRGTGDGP